MRTNREDGMCADCRGEGQRVQEEENEKLFSLLAVRKKMIGIPKLMNRMIDET